LRPMRRIEAKFPVARTEGLLIERVGDEAVVYDSASKQAHCLNPLAALLFAHCDGGCSVEELAALAAERLDEPVAPAHIRDALAQLEERELIFSGSPALSRRDLMRRTAVVGGAAFAAPLITTILAPTAASAASQFCNVPCKCCTTQPECVGSPSCNCTAASSGEVGKHCKAANAGASSCINFPCPTS
jgi:PqqD family protein of HPr-rel-A system